VWLYSQAAHVGGLADGKGRGLKVPDSHVAALCAPHPSNKAGILVPGCHADFDEHRIDADRGWEFIAKTYIWLIEDGRLRVVG